MTKTVKTPYVINTPFPHKPTAIKYKEFKEGQTVKGVIQYRGGKPAYIVVKRVFIIPINAVKELVTREVETSDNFTGNAKQSLETFAKTGNPKIKYMDAALAGAVVGLAAVWFAQKKNWLTPPDKKNYGYGALGGAAIFTYIVYRIRNRNKK